MTNLKKDLTAFKNFENMYRKLGGDSFFYMKLDDIYEMLLKDIGDNEEQKNKIEEWYREKNAKGWKNIGIATLGGAVGGAAIGGLALSVHTPLMIAAAGSACISSGGIVAIAIVGGVVLVGLGLLGYKLFCKYKMNQLQKKTDAGDEGSKIMDADTAKLLAAMQS